MREKRCTTIITCGHSLGGAVSSIAAIKLMKLVEDETISIHNITFGAPFFADRLVSDECRSANISGHLLHYVGHQDVVPAILTLGHTVQTLLDKVGGKIVSHC